MATTYYVSGSGSNKKDGLTPKSAFRTIQKAANLTQPGDVVYVMNGTYTTSDPNDNIVSITRSGTSDAWITYKAYPGAKPKLVSRNWNAFAILGASYIVIDGFELQGNNYNITLRQAIEQRSNLRNPLTSGDGIGVVASQTIPSTYPHHIVIRNNMIYGFGGAGISTIHADYITIENNMIYDNAWYSPFANSGISNYQNRDFDSYTGYKMIVRNNVTYNNKNLIPWFQSGEISDGNGIIIDDARNTQNNSVFGVYQGRTLIENNLSYRNGGRGIQVYESDAVDIINNTTHQNSRHPASTSGEITINSANDVRVLNNIMSATSGKPANTVLNSTNIIFDSNLLFNSSTYSQTGSNDLIGIDPKFLDSKAGNFALPANSPAINRGMNRLTDSDIFGKRRPTNSAITLGAFEGVGIIQGTNRSDRLVGTHLADWINSEQGNDRILGGRGNDRLIGGRGNDTLIGGHGDDTLIGGLGRDRLTGGTGRDVFQLRRNQGVDVITDFQTQDSISLPRNINFEGLEFVQAGTNTLIKVGSDSLALLIGTQANQLLQSNFISGTPGNS